MLPEDKRIRSRAQLREWLAVELSHYECGGMQKLLNLIDGKIAVEFSEAQQKRSRVNYDGKVEHFVEIRDSVATMKKIPDLNERLEAYK